MARTPARAAAATGSSVVVVLPEPRSSSSGKPSRRQTLRKSSSVSYLPPLVGKTAEQLEAEAEAKRTGSTFYRLRHHLAPWYIAGGLAAAATTAWTAGIWVDPTLVAATTGATALGAGGLIWHQTRSSIPRVRGRYPLRRRLAQAGLTSAAWLTAAAGTGPTWTAGAALGIGTLAFGAGWWRAHRIPAPTAPPKVTDVERFDRPELRSEEWADFVACQTGPVPGSKLYGREYLEHGEAWTCQLNRTGRQTLSTVLAALEQIATNMNVPMDRIVIEPHPSKLPSLLSVKFVDTAPLSAENTQFTGPRIDNWLVPLGPYADGQGEYTWRIWEAGGTDNPSDGSAWSGFICGGTGMGKSRLMENLVINAVSTGQCVVWFIDGQSGGSSPDIMANADWYVELAAARKAREAVERIMHWRAKENSANGWTGFVPSVDRPLLMVCIDECHLVFADKKESQAWSDIARMCRKVGVSIVAASQQADLTSFGGHGGLRDAIMTGNGLCMRTQSKTNGQLLTGLPVDPTTLPRIAGYGYACDSPVARSAPWRNRLVRNAAEWFAKFRQPRLDPLALKAAGTEYAERATSPDEVRGGTRAEIEAFLAGPTPSAPIDRATTDADAAAMAEIGIEAPDFPTWEASVAQVEAAEKVDQMANLDLGHGWTLGDYAQAFVDDQAATAEDVDEPDLPASWVEVLEAVAAGNTAKADIMAATDSPESTVRTALNGLMGSDLIDRTGRGRYELTAKAADRRVKHDTNAAT